ncbi:MAG: hypothetical protein K6E75_00410 [Lachnospiraceae bacterium]|nr:hypothetical protein [Lachnospiraceae bacterium]
MLPYEQLQKKGEPAPSTRGDVSVLIELLSDLNKDKTSAFYGKLGEYAIAISMIMKNSSFKKREKDVKNAMTKLESFNDFLISGENNTVYQDLLTEGSAKYGKNKHDIDKALNSFSKFVQMGLDLNKIQQKQAEFDENNVGLIDDGKTPLESAEIFEKRTRRGNTFAAKPNERKSAQQLSEAFSSAVLAMEDQISAYERKKQRNSAVSDEDTQAYEQNIALVEKLKKYQSALKILTADPGGLDHGTPARQSALNDLRDMQSVLEDGMPVTNYNWIIKQAAKGNQAKSEEVHEVIIKRGLNTLDSTLHYGINPAKATELKQEYKDLIEQRKQEQARIEKAKNNRTTADKWLNYLKHMMSGDKRQAKDSFKQYPKDYFATIMAARDIAGVERNQPSILMRTSISQYDLKKRREALIHPGGHLAQFLDKLASDPAYLAKAEKAASAGHCGGVDDMFKDYLKNLPAGQLKNDDPSIARFMPTVQERIEALQKQAKACRKKGEMPYAQAAEIVVLRNMIKAERYEKDSLNFKIPLPGKNLSDEVTKMASRESFRDVVTEPKVLSNIGSGHGGEMLTQMRKAYGKTVGKKDYKAAAEVLAEGTFDGRLKQIKLEAGQYRKELDKLMADHKKGVLLDADDFGNMYKKCRALIAEDIALNQYFEKHPKTTSGDNIPWKKIRKLQGEIMDNLNMNGALFDGETHNPEKIGKRLDQLRDSEGTMGFYESAKKDVTTYINKLKAQALEQEQADRDRQAQEKENASQIKETRTTSKNRQSDKPILREEEFEKMMEQMEQVHNRINANKNDDIQKSAQKLTGPGSNTTSGVKKNAVKGGKTSF